MSWTQTITPRDDLPAAFVKWADEQLGERLDAVVGDVGEPRIWHLTGESGKSLRLDL